MTSSHFFIAPLLLLATQAPAQDLPKLDPAVQLGVCHELLWRPLWRACFSRKQGSDMIRIVILLCLVTPALAQQLPPLVIGDTRPTIMAPVPIPDFVLSQCGGPEHVTIERGVWVCK